MRKGFALSFIIGVLLIVSLTIIAIGLFVFKKTTKNASTTESSTAQASNETANLKTYSNQYFSLKYPSNMNIKELEKDFFSITSSSTHKAGNMESYDFYMSIDMRPSQMTLDYDTIVKNQSTKFMDAKITPIKNLEGVIISGKFGPDDPNQHTLAYVRYQQSAVGINYIGSTNQINMFDQILSTLKFKN